MQRRVGWRAVNLTSMHAPDLGWRFKIERDHNSRAIRSADWAANTVRSTVIFDGDDTLWRTMPLYTASKQRFFALMDNLGFDSKAVENDFEARDIKNVSAWGFTVERFRRSM